MIRIADNLGQDESVLLNAAELSELKKEIIRERAILLATQDIRNDESLTAAVHTGIAFIVGGVLAGLITAFFIGRKK